jgi:hypothetical protein
VKLIESRGGVLNKYILINIWIYIKLKINK